MTYANANAISTTIIDDNERAKQKMNQMYLDQFGAKAKISVINFFDKGSIPFQILSIAFSWFGFYFDFFDGFGAVASLLIGMLFGLFLEGAKHNFVKGAFAGFHPLIRVALAGGAFIFTLIAATYHYKSLQTFENMSIREQLSTQVNKEYDLANKTMEIIASTQTNNKNLTPVLKNGTTIDDKATVEGIKSNNDLALALTKNHLTPTAQAFQNSVIKTAKDNRITLLFLFITTEIFSLFGAIAKILNASETSGNIKSLIKTTEKIQSLEENVVKIVETFLMNKVVKKVENTIASVEQETNSPTPQKTQDKNKTTQPMHNQLPYSSNYLQEIYGNPSVKNHFLNSIQSPQNNWLNGELPIMPSSSELTVYNKEKNQEKSRRLTDGISKIIKIIDFENDTWLYYDKWIIMEDNNCTQSESCRVGGQLEDGFTMEELENKTTDRFIFSSVVKTEKQKLIWMEFVHAANKQYHLKNDEQNQEEGVIEAETVEEIKKETTVKAFNEKVPAIDLKVYSPDEQKFLIELFDNGNVRFRESLIGRRFVLKADAIKKIKNKAGKLGEFYIKLCETGIIEKVYLHPNNPVHKYIALAELHREKWQEK